MKRVLIVAYYFPPLAGIGSIRLSRLAHYLPEFGWEPVVLAPRGTPPYPADPAPVVQRGARSIRSTSLELSRISGVQRAASRSLLEGPRRLNTWPFGASCRMRRPPSDGVPGSSDRVVAGGGGCRPLAVRRERFDAVFSFLVSDHRAFGGRDSPVESSRAPVAGGVPRPLERPAAARPVSPCRPGARAMDRSRSPIRSSMPTPTWAALLRYGLGNGHRGPAERARHGARRSDVPADPPVARARRLPLPRALFRFLDRSGRRCAPRAQQGEPASARAVGRRRAGWCARPRPPRSHGRHRGRVHGSGSPRTGDRAHAREASMLFASGPQGSDPLSRGWVPAKLFEYIASGRSVLFIGDPAGDAAALLRGQAGCFVSSRATSPASSKPFVKDWRQPSINAILSSSAGGLERANWRRCWIAFDWRDSA